ncbi:MAG: glutathione S-transferase [Sphingorhabdus sp.]
MAELPILYSFRRCPYAMRARMAIAVSGVQVEQREVVLRDKPPELLAASPKATVPVLVLTDGVVIDESLDIMRWALGQNDSEGWLAADGAGLIIQNDGPFKAALDRYKYPHRYGLESGETYRDEGFAILVELDGRLQNQPYLSGQTLGLTDIAIFPFIRQFAATNQSWFDEQPLPQLHRWLDQLLSSNLFARIMLRYPQWKTGDPPTIFP